MNKAKIIKKINNKAICTYDYLDGSVLGIRIGKENFFLKGPLAGINIKEHHLRWRYTLDEYS